VFDSGGSRRHLLGGYAELRIPPPKCRLLVAMYDACADLEQEMCAAWGPGHLLLLAEALADHSIHGRFHETGADPFDVPIVLVIVRDETLVVLNRHY
jgi:hypothetical protein